MAAVEKFTYDSREAWLAARRNHIGGSDAAACLGLSPYKDNVQLWEEKMGLVIPEDISGKEYVRYGNYAEPHLRALYALDHPEYEVIYDEYNMFVNPEYPWMHASLDGELVEKSTGRRGILEIKTTTIIRSEQWELWNNRIPDQYYCQILHYLAVTGYEFVVVKSQIKYKKGDELQITTKHNTIQRSDVERDIETLVESERKMWDCVVSGTRPHLILPAI